MARHGSTSNPREGGLYTFSNTTLHIVAVAEADDAIIARVDGSDVIMVLQLSRWKSFADLIPEVGDVPPKQEAFKGIFLHSLTGLWTEIHAKEGHVSFVWLFDGGDLCAPIKH